MIIASLSDSARYESLNPLFQRAFDFVREAGPASLEPGPHVLEEDALIVMVNEPAMTSTFPFHGRKGLRGRTALPWKSLPNRSTWKRTRSITTMRRTPLLP